MIKIYVVDTRIRDHRVKTISRTNLRGAAERVRKLYHRIKSTSELFIYQRWQTRYRRTDNIDTETYKIDFEIFLYSFL